MLPRAADGSARIAGEVFRVHGRTQSASDGPNPHRRGGFSYHTDFAESNYQKSRLFTLFFKETAEQTGAELLAHERIEQNSGGVVVGKIVEPEAIDK